MQVFCPCREPKNCLEHSVPTLLNCDEFFHDLNRLLFCPQCTAVRCPWCTLTEPVMWFCSRCLAESTKSDARKAGNHCLRDCVRCPQCYANLRVRSSPDGWNASCCRCEYRAQFPKTESTFAQECQKLQKAEFSKVLNWVPQQWTTSSVDFTAASTFPAPELPTSEELVPLLIPLRAKFTKYCRQCNTVLSDPELDASKPKFRIKHIARPMLPHFELHGSKILLRNFSKYSMSVQLAPYPPSSLISFSRLTLEIPPAQPLNNVAETGFLAPLSLVERETVASRQAFMANQSKNISGPGWHCLDIEGSTEEDYIYVFASVNLKDKTISVWYRFPTPHDNLAGPSRSRVDTESDLGLLESNESQVSLSSSETGKPELAVVEPVFKPVFTPATVLRLRKGHKGSPNDALDTANVDLDVD